MNCKIPFLLSILIPFSLKHAGGSCYDGALESNMLTKNGTNYLCQSESSASLFVSKQEKKPAAHNDFCMLLKEIARTFPGGFNEIRGAYYYDEKSDRDGWLSTMKPAGKYQPYLYPSFEKEITPSMFYVFLDTAATFKKGEKMYQNYISKIKSCDLECGKLVISESNDRSENSLNTYSTKFILGKLNGGCSKEYGSLAVKITLIKIEGTTSCTVLLEVFDRWLQY